MSPVPRSAWIPGVFTVVTAIAAAMIPHSSARGMYAPPIRSVGLASAGPSNAGALQARRIVAIGDVHGAFDELTAILKETGLVDDDLNWSGGDTIFVQTGDFTDRGAEVRKCMDLLMRLQQEAPADGGEVIVLLANHEVMSLISAFRDVAPAEYATWVDDASQARQDDAFEDWARIRVARARAAGEAEPVVNDELRAAWEVEYPLGYSERVQAMGPEGTYGRWLRGLPTAVRLGDILFMHAGPNLELSDRSPEEINDLIRNEIESFDEIKAEMVERDLITANAQIQEIVAIAHAEIDRLLTEHGVLAGGTAPENVTRLIESLQLIANVSRWQVLNQDGYHWFQGFGMWPDAERATVDEILVENQAVARIVVAHMTRPDATITVRFGGRVLLIDTGMLAERYGGRPSALEIVDGRFTAIYLDERVELDVGMARRQR